jgi:hypothetical protein
MNPTLANIIVNLIPASCPFAHTIKVGGFSLTIPPLCKLNPFYNQLMELRFKALEVLEG